MRRGASMAVVPISDQILVRTPALPTTWQRHTCSRRSCWSPDTSDYCFKRIWSSHCLVQRNLGHSVNARHVCLRNPQLFPQMTLTRASRILDIQIQDSLTLAIADVARMDGRKSNNVLKRPMKSIFINVYQSNCLIYSKN